MALKKSSSGSLKTTIATVVYGIIGVITSGIGVVIVAANYDIIFGVALIIAGIVLFGWSCFARSWLFRPKDSHAEESIENED